MNLIGIIDQLSTTLGNRVLAPKGLSMNQFGLLNHMAVRGKNGRTVTEIADAMQAPQPGITKTVQKLTASGLMTSRPHPEDGRSKILFLTTAGKKAHAEAVALLVDFAEPLFRDIGDERLSRVSGTLEQMKDWFDENR